MTHDEQVHHACTVNGHDAQHWWERLQELKRMQGAAYLRGGEKENRRWEQATGHTLKWFLDQKRTTPEGAAGSTP